MRSAAQHGRRSSVEAAPRRLAGGLLLCALCAHGVAAAQDTADAREARALFEQAREAQRGRALERAQTLYRRSLQLEPRAATAFNLAVVLEARGRAVAAHELFSRLLAEDFGPLREAQRREVEALREEAAGAFARVRVTVEGQSGVALTVDDQPASSEPLSAGVPRTIALSPGVHELALRPPRGAAVRRRVVAEAGGRHAVVVALPLPEPEAGGAEAADPDLAWLWVSLGVAAAVGLALGVGFAVDAAPAEPLEDEVFGVTETLGIRF